MSETVVMTDVRQRREVVVREHLDAENRQDTPATVATFSSSSARMDVPAFGADGQLSGHDAVQAMYEDLFAAFPDIHFDWDPLRHGDDHVLVEARMSGTQHADWARIPNTGRHFTARIAGIFDFEGDQLVCERAYFDLGDIARQLAG
jgi:steroid delta-isomerase-like uncharacterized protein